MMTFLGATILIAGLGVLAAASFAWFVETNSWRSNGFDSDPRLRL